MNEPALPPGVVFDCDGTLVDSERISRRAWRVILAAHGYEPSPADFAHTEGHPLRSNHDYFARHVDLPHFDDIRAAFNTVHADLIGEGLLTAFPDAVDALRAAAAAGVRIAVASTSRRSHVEHCLAVAGVTDLVTAIVTAEDVDRLKPDPQPYLRAAELLGVAPSDCTAVEDSPAGVASARSAGMFCVGVDRLGVPERLAAADRLVDHLEVDHLIAPSPRVRRDEVDVDQAQ